MVIIIFEFLSQSKIAGRMSTFTISFVLNKATCECVFNAIHTGVVMLCLFFSLFIVLFLGHFSFTVVYDVCINIFIYNIVIALYLLCVSPLFQLNKLLSLSLLLLQSNLFCFWFFFVHLLLLLFSSLFNFSFLLAWCEFCTRFSPKIRLDVEWNSA